MNIKVELDRPWNISDLVEVKLVNDTSFLKVVETLKRIGIGVLIQDRKSLYQTAHILHKRGKYYIAHFKSLFSVLDNKHTVFNEVDFKRQNRIAKLLDDWDLIKIVFPEKLGPMEEVRNLKILKYSEADNWNLISKYSLGTKLHN